MKLSLALLILTVIPLALTAPAPAIAQQQAPWQDVTPRAGLAGWRTVGGDASYSVVDGELVGRAALGRKNSWLVSDAQYGDFIIEYEAKTDPVLNSGVMIRGQSRPDYREGVVHGYQAEIDPTPRAWSAGIYDEQRRQWLYTLARNDAARRTFRPGDWNSYRVEAIGNRLRTFINGVPAADIADDTDARGFIAFQVHALPDNLASRGPEVRFRKIRMITDSPARYALPPTALEQQGWLTNRLSDAERRAGWNLLWDGSSGKGWRGVKGRGFPSQGWSIKDGVLSAQGGGGDIVTIADYGDFELSVDFRLTPGANSGIKYLVDRRRLAGGGPVTGLEYQLLDDSRHPDAKLGRDGNRTLASLYDLITAKNLADPASPGKRVNPIGAWNRAVVLVRGQNVEHWLNGVKLVQYDRGSPAFRALVAASKFASVPGFGEAGQGAILLQEHGGGVDFRSIKLREIKGE